jgi:protein O-GlcNAc transferase
VTIDEKFNQATAQHRANRLREAKVLYREILAEDPTHHQAMHFLGMAGCQEREYATALALIQQAIALYPNAAEYYLSLGVALDCLGRADEAIAAFGKALHLRPDYPQAHNNIGNVHGARGEWRQALAYYELALMRKPDYVEGHYNLANALGKLGRVEESLAEFRRTAQLSPTFPKAWEGLGNVLHISGRPEEAVGAFQKSIKLRPDHAQTHYTLGISLHQLDRFDEAIAAYRRAVELDPKHSQAHTNLGVALKMTGRLAEAMQSYEGALKADPANVTAHDALLYLLHFSPDYGPDEILHRHRQYDEQYGKALSAAARPFMNDRNPERRLKIGYISPDLREHVIGWNMLPLLSAHDHVRHEIYCYASVPSPDQLTKRLREKSDVWRDISASSDEEAAQMVRSDRIDILVDLTLHMHRSRLLVLARRPAPVQVTYLGYCSTTGLSGVQYRLSDPHLDPPETDLKCYVEETVRLPRTYWSYHPCGETPDVAAAPAAANGYITFGCMNNFAKVSRGALDLWARILLGTPRSKLLLHCWAGSHQETVLERFRSHGVEEGRVELMPFQKWPQYIESYQRIDVALDPFPYNGGITTFDALWMGVPVVTLSGRTAVGRAGRSILSNLGLPELIGHTPEEYVRIGTEAEKWIGLRPTLRQRMQDSPLMDAKSFARDMEAAYREMWTRWTKQA